MILDQPELSLYYLEIRQYEKFVAFCLFSGMLIAYFMVRYAKPSKTLWMPPLLLIMLVGALLRIPPLFQAFWYDEAFTSVMTSVPFTNFAIAITGDVHPPLYYLIVKLVTLILGHSDLAMRLPAYLAGIALIPVMGQIGSQYGPPVGRSAALATAILPAAIYYSTEARYPMFLVLMLAIAWLALEHRAAAYFALALSAAALVHVNAWIYVGIFSVLWLVRHRNLAGVVLPVLSVGLWLPVAITQAADVADGFWLIQYLPVRHLLEMSVTGRFTDAREMVLPAIAATFLVFSSVWLWRKNISWSWLLVVAGVPAVQSLVGLLWNPVYLPRTLMFSTMLLIIPVAWSIQHHRMTVAAAIAVAAVAMSTGFIYANDRNGMADDAIALCDSYQLIYTTNVHSAILANHFSDALVELYPYGNSIAQQLPESSQKAMFNLAFLQPNENACLYSQVSVFNTRREMEYLNSILSSRPNHSYVFAVGDLGYYLVTVFEEKLR